MKVTVVGSGISGKSLALMAKSANFDVFVTEQGKLDENTKALFREKDIQWEEGEHTKALLDCDLVVLSSGISDKALPVQMARKTGTPLQGELDFIYPYLSGKIVGVTGTNGKSTTAALINHLLSKMGYNVALAGNFGIPLADFAMMPLDFIVVELVASNFTGQSALVVMLRLLPTSIPITSTGMAVLKHTLTLKDA